MQLKKHIKRARANTLPCPKCNGGHKLKDCHLNHRKRKPKKTTLTQEAMEASI